MPSPLEPPRPLDGVACPYPGPRPFWRKDSGCFFGRDRERADLANLALTYPVTVLYAQSGNGKTSLLEAGLASRVAREGARVLSARVGAETPPGAGRERPFSMALLGTIREDDKLLAAGAQLERWSAAPLCGALAEVLEAIGLVSPARSGPGPGGRRASAEDRLELEAPVILVVDQFEELFTTNLPQWGARRDFLNDLGAATRRIRDLHVVLAIREDYLAELDPYAPLMPDGLRIRYRLERLRQAQAIEAITGPLATLGVDLDHSLTSRVVRDLLRTRAADRSAGGVEYDGEFAEPVHVQVACQQLWEDLRGASPDAPVGSPSGESAARESAQFGFRVHGRRFVCAPTATRGIDEALAQMYRSALRRAAREASTPEGKIRRFADHELITEAGTRNLASLDDFERAGLAKAAADVLVDERVLHRELRRGMAWYELTHDRFV
ncbi:MAG TPA: ATP-binding protein, partial [Polyangiaceae bacterium]|nr:ATP-binding protein [Polyangiaceae bacterium]